MRRTASEILNMLEMRVARLERTAARRDPRKVGNRTSLLTKTKKCTRLLAIAKRAGFRSAKIQFQGDNPVLVLDRGFYVPLTREATPSRTHKVVHSSPLSSVMLRLAFSLQVVLSVVKKSVCKLWSLPLLMQTSVPC